MSAFRMAWRNVWRNPRRSLVTMGAMALSLCVLVLYSGLIRGYQASLERNVVDLETADVQIFKKGYRDRPSVHERITDPDALLARLDAAGYPASVRLKATGLAAATSTSAGAQLIGLDVERDRLVSRIHQEVAVGEWLDPRDAKGVVLGRRLARSLDLAPGGEIVLLTTGADGSMANDVYRVRGVLRSIGDATDRAGIYMNAAAWRELLVLPDGAHQVLVRRPPHVALAVAREEVARLAPDADVQSWRELLPAVANMMEAQEGATAFMFIIVYVAVGMVILNAMMMAVFERIRELGVLKALGMSPWVVFGLVFAEGALQTLVALVVGLVVAAPLLMLLQTHGLNLESLGGLSIQGVAFDPVWRAEVSPAVFKGPVVALLIVVAAAVLFPALKAARLEPVAAIHHR